MSPTDEEARGREQPDSAREDAGASPSPAATKATAEERAVREYETLLHRLSHLAESLGTARDHLTIFRDLRDFSVVSVPCIGIFISLYDAERDVRTAEYAWGDETEVDISSLPPMPVTREGPNSQAVRTRQVVMTNVYWRMKQSQGQLSVVLGADNGLHPQSSLVVPMLTMGRIVGTVEVQAYQNHAYREEHVTAMRMAANLAAVAIENMRLLRHESRARAAAEESNRLKDEFLATLSHELRTPLTAILGWSNMMLTGKLDDATARGAAESIERNARAQHQIVTDLPDVSRIITGNLYLELHPIEIESVLDAAVNVVRPTAEAQNIRIYLNFDQEPVTVSGDTNRSKQVFWNLLSNAVKFTPSGGQVTVRLRQVESQVEIEVTDTGQGIRPDFLPFVFD